MYHARFKGTHYEAGRRWGSLLLRRKNIILEKVPFEITGERVEYALSCLPIYEKYYHEITEEIQGLADGQGCDVRMLQAVLFSMYAMPPACHCSCFAVAAGREILLGRNSDFLTALEKRNLNVIYTLTDGAHPFTGNTTAFVEMEDGVNARGLAAGLTSVYPRRRELGFTAGLLLRYLLEKCGSVPEAVSCLRRLPIASAQTLTLADASGNIALVECDAERTEIAASWSDGRPFVCATNAFHLEGMTDRGCADIDDWSAETRYQTMRSALQDRKEPDLTFAKELLSGDHGFLCQYDRSAGRDTVWSVIYDLGRRGIYRSEGNPRRRGFREDPRFRF